MDEISWLKQVEANIQAAQNGISAICGDPTPADPLNSALKHLADSLTIVQGQLYQAEHGGEAPAHFGRPRRKQPIRLVG